MLRTLMHRTMNFAYIEQGVPRVLTARVMMEFPIGMQTHAQHVLSNIAIQRNNLFVINDEDVEYQSGALVTDHVTWNLSDRTVTAIPRAEKDPANRSCICCAMADYFTRQMGHWMRSRKQDADKITLDVVLADHEDSQFIDDNATDLEALFFQTSVYVLEKGSATWSSYGVFFTDQRKFDGHTIFLKEKGTAPVSSPHLQVNIADYNPYGSPSDGDSLHSVLSGFTDRFGMYNGIFMIKEEE